MITLDFYIIGQELMFLFWQKPLLLKYVEIASGPFTALQSQIHAFFETTKYELTFTGQVIHIEHVLNDEFDPINRTIEIDDGPDNDEVYLFNLSENNEETYLFNASESAAETYLFNASEGSQIPDFIVKVPTSVSFDSIIMNELIKKYKCDGFTYSIETI